MMEDSNGNNLGVLSSNSRMMTSKNNELESSYQAQSTYISNPTPNFGKITQAKRQPTTEGAAKAAPAVPYHKWRVLEALAIAHGKDGITFKDVQKKFALRKIQARYLLYSYSKQRKLHTAGRKKPQRYFLTKQAAEFGYLQSTYNDVTGVNGVDPSNRYHDYTAHIPASSYAVASSQEQRIQLQEQERVSYESAAKTLANALAKAEHAPLGIHNIRLKVRLHYKPYDAANDDNPYDRVSQSYLEAGKEGKQNRTKLYPERVGDKEIFYRLYPNNTVMISIACTDNPFPLDSQEHITSLFCFLGGRRDTLRLWLSDTSDQFVPPVHDWYLTEADLNKDVQLTAALYYHVSMVRMQLRTIEGVFREYAKPIDGRFYFRQEKMLRSSVSMTESNIFHLMANTRTSYTSGGSSDSGRGGDTVNNMDEDGGGGVKYGNSGGLTR